MSSPGEKIRELRLMADMSQEELGKRVGVQRAAIQKYEKGTVSNIPLGTLEKIANVFNVSPTYLVGWGEIDHDKLSMEVRVIKGISVFYGEPVVRLLEIYTSLSNVGQKKIIDYAEDIEPTYIVKK
jgi:transcriptional regulator with XRE-family HTH domain